MLFCQLNVTTSPHQNNSLNSRVVFDIFLPSSETPVSIRSMTVKCLLIAIILLLKKLLHDSKLKNANPRFYILFWAFEISENILRNQK